MDQGEAYRQIWQAFRTYKQLADGRHDTDEWRRHQGVFAACVIRVPETALQPALDGFRAVLASEPFTRVHPPSFLHIMLQELGFVRDHPEMSDEISPNRLEEFSAGAAAAMAEQAPFRLTLGGANSFQDAAFLDVHDNGRCAKLHQRLHELSAARASSRFAYVPHVTVAHYTADAPVGNLPAVIAPWRDRLFGTLTVHEIEIVTLRLDEPYPPLESYAIIPLGG